MKEHLKALYPIYDHHNIMGHPITVDSFSIVVGQDQNLAKTIKKLVMLLDT